MDTILLLEDDVALAETLQELLESEGYTVDVAHSGEEAAQLSYERKYDLYIFDINVPEINGLELLEDLRGAQDATPAIFISALIDIETIAKGFAVGAEDYIKKPFFPEELLIRVNAKLQKNVSKVIEYGTIRYDTQKRELHVDGKVLRLGEVQECLCDVLMRNIADVVDKSILMDCLTHPSDAALRVAINKLKQTTSLPVKNVRGVGYILEKSGD